MARTFHALPQIVLNLQNCFIYRTTAPPLVGQAGISSRASNSIFFCALPNLDMKISQPSHWSAGERALPPPPRSEGTTESTLNHHPILAQHLSSRRPQTIVIIPTAKKTLQTPEPVEDKPDSQPSQTAETCSYLYRLIYI